MIHGQKNFKIEQGLRTTIKEQAYFTEDSFEDGNESQGSIKG